MQILSVVWLLVGIVAGAVMTWLIANGHAKSANARTQELLKTIDEARRREDEAKVKTKEADDRSVEIATELKSALEEKGKFQSEASRVDELKQVLAGRDSEVKSLNDRIADLDREKTEALKDAEAANKRADEMIAKERETQQAIVAAKDEQITKLNEFIEKAQLVLTKEFKSLSGDVLRGATEQLIKTADGLIKGHNAKASGEFDTKKAEIDGLIGPMKTALTSLDENVRSLKQSENSLLVETRELATALKDSKRRGNWGELQLRRIAELAGMLERCDFTLQEGVVTNENRRLFPDMTARLPNNRVIVVDSKASMVAYGEAANSTNPEIQKQKLLEHAKAVRKRVDELALKEYRSHVEGSADFVVCFIPGEGFFSAAVSTDPELLEYAAERNVILASPTTLLTLLRAVALGWKEAKLADDAKHICALGLELYERLRTSTGYIVDVGQKLESVVESYDSFIGSMEKRVFPQARRFRSLVASDKELPSPKSVEIKVRKPVGVDWISEAAHVLNLAAEGDEQADSADAPIS